MRNAVDPDPAPPVMADFARAWSFAPRRCSEGAAHCDRCRCGDTPVFGTEAQQVERPFVKRMGAGSNPAGPATNPTQPGQGAGAADPAPEMVGLHPLRPSRPAAARAVTGRDTGHRSTDGTRFCEDRWWRFESSRWHCSPENSSRRARFSGCSSAAERAARAREVAGAIPAAQTHASHCQFQLGVAQQESTCLGSKGAVVRIHSPRLRSTSCRRRPTAESVVREAIQWRFESSRRHHAGRGSLDRVSYA